MSDTPRPLTPYPFDDKHKPHHNHSPKKEEESNSFDRHRSGYDSGIHSGYDSGRHSRIHSHHGSNTGSRNHSPTRERTIDSETKPFIDQPSFVHNTVIQPPVVRPANPHGVNQIPYPFKPHVPPFRDI